MKKKAILLVLSAVLLPGAVGGALSSAYAKEEVLPIRAEGETDTNHLGEAAIEATNWEGENAFKEPRVEISLKGVTFDGTNVVPDIAAFRDKLNTLDYIYVDGKKLSEIATEEALKGVSNPYGINLWRRTGILLYIPGLTADKDGHYTKPLSLVIKKGCQLPAAAADKNGNFKYYTVAQDAGWGEELLDTLNLGVQKVNATNWEGQNAFKEPRVEISLEGVTFEGINVVPDIAAFRTKLNTLDYIYVDGKKLSEIATEEALKGVSNPYGINLWRRTGILLYIPGLTADKDGYFAKPNQLVIKKGCQLPAAAAGADGNFKYYTVAQDAGWGLDAVLDTESSGDITVKESVNDLGTPTPFYSGFSGSKWQIGGDMIAPGKGKDNYIMLFFDGGDYGDKATYTLPDGTMDMTKATKAIDTSQIQKAGTFEHIYIDGVQLASIEGIYSAEKYYNLWTIWGVVAFKVPTLAEGAIVKEIKIDAGTKFPKRVQDDPTKVKYYTVPKETIVKTKYIMHFMNEDGTEEWGKQILGFGDPVTPPEAPKKKGYTFDHWEDVDGNPVTDFVLSEQTGNVSYYGVYKKNADPTPTSSEQPTPTSSEQPTPQSSSSGGTTKKKKGGCGGSIGGSLVGASFGLLGLGLLVFKRRKKEK